MEPKDPQKVKYQAMAASMRELLRSPGWDSYREELEEVEKRWLQRLLSGDRDSFDFNKGVIDGLRQAFHLPQQIIDRVSEL